MNVKLKLSVALVFFVLVGYSCKKNNDATVTTNTVADNLPYIDSMVGYYQGTTYGDSVYTYTDASGKVQQTIRSFSWPDTLYVSSADTVSITTASKYYNITFPYGDSLTLSYVTYLQKAEYITGSQAPIYSATISDTSGGVDHLTININYGATKHVISNFYLYKKQ